MSLYINEIVRMTRRNPEPTPERQDLILEAIRHGVPADTISWAIEINTPDEITGRSFCDELLDALKHDALNI